MTKLEHGRKKGRVIMNLSYTNHGRNLHIPLRLVKARDTRYPHKPPEHATWEEGEKLLYMVDIDKPQIYVCTDNAEATKKDVFALLDKMLTITWKPMILVVSNSQTSYFDHKVDNAALEITIKYADYGVETSGKHLHVDRDRNRTKTIREDLASWGWPGICDVDGQPEEKELGSQIVTAAIDDTPENRARVVSIVQGLKNLAKAVSELLAPTRINESLKLMAIPQLALPAPDTAKIENTEKENAHAEHVEDDHHPDHNDDK